jgi:hypothetical protein
MQKRPGPRAPARVFTEWMDVQPSNPATTKVIPVVFVSGDDLGFVISGKIIPPINSGASSGLGRDRSPNA